MYRNHVHYRARGVSVFLATILAGPAFILFLLLAEIYMKLPAAIPVRSDIVLGLMLFFLPAAVTGAIVGLPFTAIGTGLMVMLGRRFAWARSPLSWAIAGGLIGSVTLLFPRFGIEGPPAFALIATSALCGWLCSRHASLSEEERAEHRRSVALQP